MNRLGMIIDLSGTSERTAMEVLERSTAPVVYSHAGVRAVYDHPRNVPDNILHSLVCSGEFCIEIVYVMMKCTYEKINNKSAQ